MKPSSWHYWIGLLLSLALIPCLRSLHLPIRFDWKTLGIAYWLVLAAQSIFVAALLSVIGRPMSAVLRPLAQRYRQAPLRIVLVVLYLGFLSWAFTVVKALVLTVDTIAILEFRESRSAAELRKTAAAVGLAALYLFAGFLLVFAYNDIIVSARFNFAYDPAFYAMDRWLLHGASVSGLSHWAVRKLPLFWFYFLEFIYFGMFAQIGAGLILVTVCEERRRGLQFVGTILTAYYLALGLFYLWPSHGPYFLCPAHFSRFPRTLQAYTIQQTLIRNALARWNHVPLHWISTDYFIAFPCMHIAQPLIVIWFLARWRRMVMALCAYDTLLILSIVLLEWHYLVDILGGVLVAGAAIAINEGIGLRDRRKHAGEMPPERQGTRFVS